MTFVPMTRRTLLSLTLTGAASLFTLPRRGQAAAPPRRVISIGAPVTEIVYALGGGAQVVAVDTTSRYPQQVDVLPHVGYMRTLAAEGLLSLSPDLILAQDGSGPVTVLDQMAAAGVTVTLVPEVPTLPGLLDKVQLIARSLGLQEAGQRLGEQLHQQLTPLEQQASTSHGLRGQSVLCLVHAGQGGPMAAGGGTVADTLIHLAGGINALRDVQDYRALSAEAALAMAPAVLVVSASSVQQAGGLEALLALPQIARTPAAQQRRVAVVEGSLLLGLGPRTPQAVQMIATA